METTAASDAAPNTPSHRVIIFGESTPKPDRLGSRGAGSPLRKNDGRPATRGIEPAGVRGARHFPASLLASLFLDPLGLDRLAHGGRRGPAGGAPRRAGNDGGGGLADVDPDRVGERER